MEIRNVYKETCKLPVKGYESKGFKHLVTEHSSEMKIDRMMVFYHRVNNIPDHLNPPKQFETKLAM
eukprot:2990359-Ditylum_brightwellii.AAC.1